MRMKTLGRTGIEVSELCLGSMTWGTQNSVEEAHDQIERALNAGINFIDTAEMYPVNPVRAETVGRSEEIVGDWVAKSGRRADVVIATKHSGEGSHSRNGDPISAQSVPLAVEGSLLLLPRLVLCLPHRREWPFSRQTSSFGGLLGN